MKITYLNALQGVGKQSKKPWYRIQFVTTIETGSMIAVEKFVSETVFNQFQNLVPGKDAIIDIGINERGEFTIIGVKKSNDSELF